MEQYKILSTVLKLAYFIIIFNPSETSSLFKLNDIKIDQFDFISTNVLNPNNNSVRKRDVSSTIKFSINFKENIYEIYIKPRTSDLFLGNSATLHIIYDNSTKDIKNLSDNINLYEGYIVGSPYTTSLNGYIKENKFYGSIILNRTEFYIDEVRSFLNRNDSSDGDVKKNAVIYRKNPVKPEKCGKISSYLYSTDVLFEKELTRSVNGLFKAWKKHGMLCSMIVVIDHSYITMIHNGNIDATIFQILFTLEEVNSRFRSTDFDNDGVPDNIGIYVKKVVVIADEENNNYFIRKYTKKDVRVDDFLMTFVRYQDLSDYCLGIVFTAQIFKNHVLGASFVSDSKDFVVPGGICERPLSHVGTLNAIVITPVSVGGQLVPQIVFESTVTHELGHSFGSFHDNEKNRDCLGHLMSPRTHENYKNRNHMAFSKCSKNQIIKSLVFKGGCFEPVQIPFCGNGIIEANEDCDCGMTLDCIEMDPCCVPRRTKDVPCKVNRKVGFQCHPSQGICCTSDCKYSAKLEKFVDCNGFEKTCPSQDSNRSCGIQGQCIGTECHSIECARINVRECACPPKKSNTKDLCNICCAFQNVCLPAIEVTQKVFLETGDNNNLKHVFQRLLKHNSTSTKNSDRQWIFKNYCLENQCVNLKFLRAKFGEYCLQSGELGKCNQSLQCKIFRPTRSFPSVKSASRKIRLRFGGLSLLFYGWVCVLGIYFYY